MKQLLVIIVVTLLGVLVVGCVFVEKFIYYPPKPTYSNSDKLIKIPTHNGGKIAAVYLANANAKFVILLSHGNGEDLGMLFPYIREIQRNGFAVLAYDYRGYGQSSGEPSEKNTYADIDAAYQYLINTKHYAPRQIICMGISLGAAVSIELATKKPVAGLILQSPFSSIFRMITRVPIIPFDRYNNVAKLKKLRHPILIIHGVDDEIIPIWHANKLYTAYKGKKMSYWVKGAGHNDVSYIGGEKYWQTIRKFADSLD